MADHGPGRGGGSRERWRTTVQGEVADHAPGRGGGPRLQGEVVDHASGKVLMLTSVVIKLCRQCDRVLNHLEDSEVCFWMNQREYLQRRLANGGRGSNRMQTAPTDGLKRGKEKGSRGLASPSPASQMTMTWLTLRCHLPRHGGLNPPVRGVLLL